VRARLGLERWETESTAPRCVRAAVPFPAGVPPLVAADLVLQLGLLAHDCLPAGAAASAAAELEN
jgi:hypothetical protein